MPIVGEFPKRSETDPPIKRLILCCDGTWQSSEHGEKSIPSNVAKMANSVSAWSKDSMGKHCPQIVYYDSGVGTAQSTLESVWSGGSGAGLAENVCEAYYFLVQNYNPGDEIYLFGFSRGAFTVRAIAGFVSDLGICTPLMMEQFWDIYQHYKDQKIDFKEYYIRESTDKKKTAAEEKDHEDHKNWLARCYRNVDIKVVGVWDTVGSLGFPSLNLPQLPKFAAQKVASWNEALNFHNVEVSPRVQNAFHALALDEHRKPFSPTLWELPHDSTEDQPTNLVQCWFPGVHINSGGGSSDGLGAMKGDLEALANVTFAWMVDRVQETTDLEFNFVSLERTVDKYINSLRREGYFNDKPQLKKSLSGRIIKKVASATQAQEVELYNDPKTRNSWGLGRIVDSLDWTRKAIESQARTPGECTKVDHAGKEHKLEVKYTKETIHPIVALRQQAVKDNYIQETKFSPNAMEGFRREPIGGSKGYEWKRQKKSVSGYIYGSTVKEEAVIPEFQMSRTLDLVDKRPGLIQGREKLSMERLLIMLGEYPDSRKPKDLGAARDLVKHFSEDSDLSLAGRFLVQLDRDYKNAPIEQIKTQSRTTQDYVAIPRKGHGDAAADHEPEDGAVPEFYKVPKHPVDYKDVMKAFFINNY